MNTASRLALYGVGLVAIFVASYAVAGAVVPDSVVEKWNEQSITHDKPSREMPAPSPMAPGTSTPDTHNH